MWKDRKTQTNWWVAAMHVAGPPSDIDHIAADACQEVWSDAGEPACIKKKINCYSRLTPATRQRALGAANKRAAAAAFVHPGPTGRKGPRLNQAWLAAAAADTRYKLAVT